MEIQAVTIDGTAIKADRIQVGQNGVTLKKHQQSGKSNQSGSKQSWQSEQSKQSHEQSQEITIVFDEDVPPEEREELMEELEAEEKGEHSSQHEQSDTRSGSQSQSKGQSGQSTGEQSEYTSIGFVPYDRLMYISPQDVVSPAD